MRVITLLTFFVIVLLAGIKAQGRCPQRARPPRCVGPRDIGSACTTAPPRRMWYYNQANRTCIAMQHLGCGGNANRWCSRRFCERRCVLRRGG